VGFADRWLCDVAVLTNVTHEHHDDHGSQSAYLRPKRLFDALRPGGIAVFTATDERAAQLMENARADIVRRGYPLTGRESFAPASVSAGIEEMSWERTQLAVESQDHRFSRISLTTPAPGDHFAENALAAWIAAISAGFDPAQAAAGIASASCRPAGSTSSAERPPLSSTMGTVLTGSTAYHCSFVAGTKQVEQLIGGPAACTSAIAVSSFVQRSSEKSGRRGGLSLPRNRTLDALQGPKIGDAFGRWHEGWGSRSKEAFFTPQASCSARIYAAVSSGVP
jgi:hypothetical protein